MIVNYCLKNFDPGLVNALVMKPLEFRLDGNVGQFYLSESQ